MVLVEVVVVIVKCYSGSTGGGACSSTGGSGSNSHSGYGGGSGSSGYGGSSISVGSCSRRIGGSSSGGS